MGRQNKRLHGATQKPPKLVNLEGFAYTRTMNYGAGCSGVDCAAGSAAGAASAGAAIALYEDGRNLNILVPHTGQAPFAAGRPFFVVTICTFWITRSALHFMQ